MKHYFSYFLVTEVINIASCSPRGGMHISFILTKGIFKLKHPTMNPEEAHKKAKHVG